MMGGELGKRGNPRGQAAAGCLPRSSARERANAAAAAPTLAPTLRKTAPSVPLSFARARASRRVPRVHQDERLLRRGLLPRRGLGPALHRARGGALGEEVQTRRRRGFECACCALRSVSECVSEGGGQVDCLRRWQAGLTCQGGTRVLWGEGRRRREEEGLAPRARRRSRSSLTPPPPQMQEPAALSLSLSAWTLPEQTNKRANFPPHRPHRRCLLIAPAVD